ncbi:hypothetical protein ACVR05_03865 [Streptococcus caprae]|uniref:TPM domain-containing protein n=1 Tax=Streptococcus caprae TaxID=1640501 RepID=A0ABV8CYQ0_9STRE
MKIVNFKNLKSLIIIMSLFWSFSFINNVSADTQLFDVPEYERALVQQYIHRSNDGILVLNTDEAIAAGINEELLGELSQNISEMNVVVIEGKGYIGIDNVLRYRNVGVLLEQLVVQGWNPTGRVKHVFIFQQVMQGAH